MNATELALRTVAAAAVLAALAGVMVLLVAVAKQHGGDPLYGVLTVYLLAEVALLLRRANRALRPRA